MTSTNNRTINGYETIDGELVLSEITNQVLATDSDGLVYGINNYISNLTSDVQTQINTINTTLANKEDLLTAANKLDMAYVGSGNVSSDELDMNIGNTTFNIYNTFLSVTGSIDSIDEYVNTLRAMIKENSEDEKFTNDMRNLFNDVKDVKEYNPDNEDFEGNENIPSEK